MTRLRACPGGVVLLTTMAACSGDVESVTTEAASRASVVMALPVTSEMPAAVEHFMLGQREADMARAASAARHFEAALESDRDMAMAHLRAAQWADSFSDYRSHLEHAEGLTDDVTEGERTLIEIERALFEGDREEALRLGEQLVVLHPESPRAWLRLAAIQTGLNRIDDARAALDRALQASPSFAPAHLALANSLILRDPRDLVTAEQHARRAIEVEPGEALPQDILGDVHRAAGNLDAAAAAYTRASELDPESSAAFQQLGHVRSFLGDFERARASYDEAIDLAEGNAKASYGIYRALTSVHQGDPQAAIDELNALVDGIDGMAVPEPVGLKINALTTLATIGLHAERIAQAENAVNRRAALLRAQVEEVGTDAFGRRVEADIAFFEGLVAVANGMFAVAEAKAGEIFELLENDPDPRRYEIAHDLMGATSLERGRFAEALEHLEQGTTTNPRNQYRRALALEALGQSANAQALYQGIANNRRNTVDVALLRDLAIEKAM